MLFNFFDKCKHTKEELQDFYEMTGVEYKNIKAESKKNPSFAKFAELMKWNTEIEKLEEGKESGHTLRVAHISKLMAEDLCLSKETIKAIYLAALFHDIGKHRIPAKILSKPGPLTDDEFTIVKTHVELAKGLLQGIVSDDVIEIVLNHHERMDGKGYPRGIIPENIGGRIIAIVDSYDAMTSKRVYNSPKSQELAFQELQRCTIPIEKGGFGYLYDPNLVEILMRVVTAEKR